MSKHCEVCNRSYPDDLDACPHCAEVVEIGEADVVDLGSSSAILPEEPPEVAAAPVMISPDMPDSAVDLGLPALSIDPNGSSSHQGAEGSGISVIEWASLVEEEPAPTASAAQFDDPADADLIGPTPVAAEVPSTAPPAGHGPVTEATVVLPPDNESEDALAADLEAVRSIFAGDASASFVRREPAKPAAEPPADADDSALNLLAGAEAAADAESEVDLGADPVASESASQKGMEPEMLEVVDSGVDLASGELEAEVVAEAMGTPPAGGDPAAMLSEEEAVSIVHPPAGDAADSGVDLSAVEVVEEPAVPASDSGIDLSGVEVVDMGAPEELAEVQVVDSGVNLSGVEVVDVAPPSEPVELGGEAVVRPISDSGIDLSPIAPTGVDSGPQAGIEQNTPGTSDSGVDLIAAEVESGMNLPSEAFDFAGDSKVGSSAEKVDEIVMDESATSLTAGQLPSSEEEVDLTETTAAEGVDSSAVDLGASSANFPVAPPEPAAEDDELNATRPYEAQAKSIHGEEEISPSEVDLGARHTGDSGKDFFEPSEAMQDAPVELPDEVDESLDLAASADSGVSVEDELTPAPEEESAVVEEEEELVPEEEAVEEEAEAPPPKKEKRRSTAGAWVGGLVLGGVVTAVLLLALWLFKIEPPTEWRGFVGGNAPPVATNGPTGQNPGGPAAPPLTLDDKAALVRSGDVPAAVKAGVLKADDPDPKAVALRGELGVRKYLMDTSLAKAPIKADDEAMKTALADLDKVKDQSDDALFWLGVAKEAANDPNGARAAYQMGLDRAKDERSKQRFQDGLNRLSAAQGPKAGPMSSAAPTLDPALLVLVMTGLTAEPPPQLPAEPAAPEEAGSKFWEAAKLAQDGQYDKAAEALGAAIDRHKGRRFAVLGKAQNPNSDPTEEIFVRSCQELKAYWTLRAKLQSSGLPIVMGKDPAADVDALIADDKKAVGDLTQAATDAKALKDKLQKADDDLTDANTKLKDATTTLADTKTKLDDANTALATTKDDLTKSQKKAEDLAANLKTANDTIAKKTDTLKGVADALKAAKALKEGDDEAAVVPAVKEILQSKDVQAVEKAIREVKDNADRTIRELKETSDKTIRTLTDERDELKVERDGLKTAVKDRRRPEEMLSFWLPLLRERTDLADEAITDADRVLNNDNAKPADRTRAHAIKGIALRSEEKYAEAKRELDLARKDLPKDDGEWIEETEDPSAYFAKKAEEDRAAGRNAQARLMLDRALKAAPAAPSHLLIERGTLLLDAALARGQGSVAENDADLAAARKDADEAMNSGAAEAFYLGGRIAEALGKLDKAADDYGKALAAHAALDSDGCRYRAALARVLMLPHDGQGSTDAAVAQALKLADEVLSARGDDVPFEARAQALAVQGLWTEALNAYAEGLRPHINPERAAVLMGVVRGHPALRRPTAMTVADPLAAAKHYAAGLQWYNDREYEKAETEFLTAVEHDGQDARYYYYLGLSRLLQGDRDAFEDFEQGARLEQQSRPGRAAVSAALERVQGEARERLNQIRDRPR